MAFPPLPPSLADALGYSDQFDYPLTLGELWQWQITSSLSLSRIRSLLSRYPFHFRSFYYLPGRRRLVELRAARLHSGQPKWVIARQVVASLARLPTISAIFVTGSLAMDNCPPDDDIDLMVITSPHTLWITRALVIIYLSFLRLRRPAGLPEHSSPRVADKICDNLYLDTRHLPLPIHNLYIAHELLQAKCLFDRASIRHNFLLANTWVGDYLPVAYKSQLAGLPSPITLHISYFINLFLYPINLVLFVLQYLYMRPKITSESIGLGFAFFHPRPPSPKHFSS